MDSDVHARLTVRSSQQLAVSAGVCASRRGGTSMRTLFLNPPSYEDFDGGAGSRYQAKREVWSFWYPTWLAYPAGMLPGARLLDAPQIGRASCRERVCIAGV